VVDNASTDGSLELLDALHGAALIHLIRNRRQRDHGPALTQAISWLARRQREVDRREQLDYVWILDSDLIVLRPTAVCDAISRARGVGRGGGRASDLRPVAPPPDAPAVLAPDRPSGRLAPAAACLRGARRAGQHPHR